MAIHAVDICLPCEGYRNYTRLLEMCFSAEVSLVTFLIGTIFSAVIFQLGTPLDKIIGLFGVYVSLMQGIEFLLWSHQTCDQYHKNVSVLGALLNSAQPIVLGILALIYSTRVENKGYVFLVVVALCLYGVYSYIDKTAFILSPELHCTQPRANDPHLHWNWAQNYPWSSDWLVYISSIVLISILGMPTLSQGIGLGAYFLISMIATGMVYPRQEVGSLWCVFGALTPPLYYAARVLKIIKA